MRFHVLGVGSIGTLISHHLRKSIRLRQQNGRLLPSNLDPTPPEITAGLPPPLDTSITLHVRRDYIAQVFRGLTVEHAGARSTEIGFRLEVGTSGQSSRTPRQILKPASHDSSINETAGYSPFRISPDRRRVAHGPSIVEQAGFSSRNDAIDSLIVTTKADATVEAIAPFSRRLTSASTLVLLQNGMGIVDELIHTLFPDPDSRPQIILGNLSHACFNHEPFVVEHAGYGSIRLGLLPDPRGKVQYERTREAQGGQASHSKGLQPSILSTDYLDSSVTYRGHLSGLTFDAIPQHPSLLTLRYTLATLLSLPLEVHWEPVEAYQVGALRKLVVNACINPLTAILDCRNGQLVGDPYAEQIWSEVCHEAAQVFLAAAQAPPAENPSSSSPSPSTTRRLPDYTSKTANGAATSSLLPWVQVTHRPLPSSHEAGSPSPLLDSSLTPPALYSAVREVAVRTSNNYSSMHSDLRGSPIPRYMPRVKDGWRPPRGRTEIEYINGYLVQLGQNFGVDVKANEMLRRLVLSMGWGIKRAVWTTKNNEQ